MEISKDYISVIRQYVSMYDLNEFQIHNLVIVFDDLAILYLYEF